MQPRSGGFGIFSGVGTDKDVLPVSEGWFAACGCCSYEGPSSVQWDAQLLKLGTGNEGLPVAGLGGCRTPGQEVTGLSADGSEDRPSAQGLPRRPRGR